MHRVAPTKMKPLHRITEDAATGQAGRKDAEQIIEAVAHRHGFRPRDFSVAWDEAGFDAALGEHRLMIRSADGREASAAIPHAALVERNPWRWLRSLDSAFAALGRRDLGRGL